MNAENTPPRATTCLLQPNPEDALIIEIWADEGKGPRIGRLWEKEGRLAFEGDVEESAQVFFDKIIRLYSEALNVTGGNK